VDDVLPDGEGAAEQQDEEESREHAHIIGISNP
jgi:hypothetical protein